MAYLRPGENPEELYIYSDGTYVQINHPTSDSPLASIPPEEFNGFLKLYIEEWYEKGLHEGVAYGDLKIQVHLGHKGIGSELWHLYYKRKLIFKLSQYTMYYLAFTNQCRWGDPHYILNDILNNKVLLPTLIGINSDLDAMITKALSKDKPEG